MAQVDRPDYFSINAQVGFFIQSDTDCAVYSQCIGLVVSRNYFSGKSSVAGYGVNTERTGRQG